MVGDLHVVACGSQRFRTRVDVDDLWHTVQPGPFSESRLHLKLHAFPHIAY